MTEMSMEELQYGPKVMPPDASGAILDHDFLTPMNIAPAYLAEAIGVDVGLIQGHYQGAGAGLSRNGPAVLAFLRHLRGAMDGPATASMTWTWRKTVSPAMSWTQW